MAGYIMTIGSGEYERMFYNRGGISQTRAKQLAKEYILEQCILQGAYSSRASDNSSSFIGILADYLGMKAGEDIFFFMNRKIYGIGRLINLTETDCRYRIQPKEDAGTDEILIDEPNPDEHPFVCTFEPSPYFFKAGVDMDEVLAYSPEKIRALRFFSGVSFIKLDDIESESIKNVIVRKNELYLSDEANAYHFEYSKDTHENMAQKLNANFGAYKLSVFDFIKYTTKSGKVSSEYFLEGAIMDLLRQNTTTKLGKWDFVARQYPASPPKPPEYIDTMDLFGYRYVLGFPTAISKYLVIELKVGTIKLEHIQQTMKYVDWVSREYAKGDYSMIEAYTIGFDQEDGLTDTMENVIARNYILEGHPIESKRWHALRILRYSDLLNELVSYQKMN